MAAYCDEPQLQPVAQAIARMQAQIAPVAAQETVALTQALDRVLAQPIQASLNVPAHDNSAMDGYALRAADSAAREPLRLIGSALAGHPFAGEVHAGTCVRITTGAPVPAGADAVVMQENTSVEGELVSVQTPVKRGDNIRRQGEDISSGDLVLPRGHRLGPVDLGLLASLGTDYVAVVRRLRVAVLSTGDELVAPGKPLPDGHIYDSNRYAIVAMLQRLAVDVVDLGLIPDDRDAITEALRTAVEQADAVISSGGVSVGDADYVKEVLGELGQVNFWKVAIKPGKPFAFGKLGDAWFFGLPGNPVSAVVTLHQLALPILRQLAGEQIQPPLRLRARAVTPYKKRPGRSDYQRAQLTLSDSGEENVAGSTGAQGSGVLTSFNGANCYVVLEQERESVAAGEWVEVLPFDRYL